MDKRKNDKNDYNFEQDLENSMREENDHLVDQVYTSVKNIKRHVLEMSGKIRQSNEQVNEMDKKYSQSSSLMNKTIKQLSEVFSANSNYWFYLIVFIFFFFFLLYKITK